MTLATNPALVPPHDTAEETDDVEGHGYRIPADPAHAARR
jgi:hypothetical protein